MGCGRVSFGPFAPLHLRSWCLPQLASQLKDTHLARAANAGLDIPSAWTWGPSSRPLHWNGRGRGVLAREGSIDSTKHMGIIFFTVQKLLAKAGATMAMENVTLDYRVNLQMPMKKQKKKQVYWGSQDLPSIPNMVNQKASKEHTRLALHQPLLQNVGKAP